MKSLKCPIAGISVFVKTSIPAHLDNGRRYEDADRGEVEHGIDLSTRSTNSTHCIYLQRLPQLYGENEGSRQEYVKSFPTGPVSASSTSFKLDTLGITTRYKEHGIHNVKILKVGRRERKIAISIYT